MKKVEDLDDTAVGWAEPSHRAVCPGTRSRHHSLFPGWSQTPPDPQLTILPDKCPPRNQLNSSPVKTELTQGPLFTVPPLKRAETMGLTRKGVRNDARGYQPAGGYATLNPAPLPFSIMDCPEFLLFSFSVPG